MITRQWGEVLAALVYLLGREEKDGTRDLMAVLSAKNFG
jgi:hypothetical protein